MLHRSASLEQVLQIAGARSLFSGLVQRELERNRDSHQISLEQKIALEGLVVPAGFSSFVLKNQGQTIKKP